MYNHSPNDYQCPICLGVQGIENEHTLLKQSDLVYKDEHVSAFINSFFIDGNDGHIIVVPNKHIENIYDLTLEYSHAIFDVAQKIAIAMKKAYECDGITLRQNNEPASDQHAFHFHLHIYPRYDGDNYNQNSAKKRLTTQEERLSYVDKVKKFL